METKFRGYRSAKSLKEKRGIEKKGIQVTAGWGTLFGGTCVARMGGGLGGAANRQTIICKQLGAGKK